jgi:hypothetical protein
MKMNLFQGIILISAVALSSCSTTYIASNQSSSTDDVYYSKATAGDQIVYAADNYKTDNYSYEDEFDRNYYLDDSYAARINRFSYYTPWRGYYDNLWLSSGYYNAAYLYSGFGIGLHYSPWAWAYSPYNYYGYSPFAYSPYSFYGMGYGNPYWGVYSYYRPSRQNPNYGARPARGSENVGYANAVRGNSGTVRMGSNGRTSTVRENNGTSTVRPTRTSTGNGATERPTRTEQARPARTNAAPAPASRPTSVDRPSSSGNNSSGSSTSSGSGARPTRSR